MMVGVVRWRIGHLFKVIIWFEENKWKKIEGMINMLAANHKEWAWLPLVRLLNCLAVWMDLSDITTLLAKEGPYWIVSGIRKMLLSFWKLFNGSFCRFCASRVAASLADADFEEIFRDGLLPMQIKKFSVPSLDSDDQRFDPVAETGDCMGMQVVTYVVPLWWFGRPRFGGRAVPGQSVGIAVLMVHSGFSVLVLIAFHASKRFKATDAWMRQRHGEFDGVWSSAPTMQKLSNEKFQVENKGLTRLNLFLFIAWCLWCEPGHDSGRVKWVGTLLSTDWGALDQWYRHAKSKIPKISPVLY